VRRDAIERAPRPRELACEQRESGCEHHETRAGQDEQRRAGGKEAEAGRCDRETPHGTQGTRRYDWRDEGDRRRHRAIATVVASRRSAPRPIGSKLGVSSGGELAGSVSGGCVESDVYAVAQDVLGGGAPRLVSYGISDELAFEVGLPCGGEIDVFVDRADAKLLGRVEAILAEGRRAVLLTVLEGDDAGAKRLVEEQDAHELSRDIIRGGRSRVVEVEGVKLFADVFAPPPRLVVIGAVDTAEALCHAAKNLGWRTIVADPRGKFMTRERIPSADELLPVWPDEALAQVQPDYDTAIVVLTHDDKFDVPALKGALETEAFYVGALGSRRNQERRRERLLEAGVAEASLERIAGPCGLDIGAHTPAETALSILAEIVAVRSGREGGSLRAASGRIHAEVA
jgi:xanthine dehydrogenase accessory factor